MLRRFLPSLILRSAQSLDVFARFRLIGAAWSTLALAVDEQRQQGAFGADVADVDASAAAHAARVDAGRIAGMEIGDLRAQIATSRRRHVQQAMDAVSRKFFAASLQHSEILRAAFELPQFAPRGSHEVAVDDVGGG